PLPQVELEQAGLLAGCFLQLTCRPLADAVAVEAGVDGRHDVALPGQQRADELAALGVGADALLGAAVAVQADDRGGGPLLVLREKEDTRHPHVHAVVELEPLQDVIPRVLAEDDLDLLRVGPGRHLTQAAQKRLAGSSPGSPPASASGRWGWATRGP